MIFVFVFVYLSGRNSALRSQLLWQERDENYNLQFKTCGAICLHKDTISCSCHNACHNYSRGKQRSKQHNGETAVHTRCGVVLWDWVISEAAPSSTRNLSAFWQENVERSLFTTQVFLSSLITHWSTWKWSLFFCTAHLTLHCLSWNYMSLFVFKMSPAGSYINRFCVHSLLTVTACLQPQLNQPSHPGPVHSF